MKQQAHIVVDEWEFACENHVVFELYVDCAFVLNEASEIRKEKILRECVITDFSMVWAIAI